MKKLVLHDRHVALGGKMVPFAGFEMPVQFSGVNDEHEAVRTGVGVFDVSHMGEFLLKGEKALDLIQWVTSNDASQLVDGKVQYSCLPNNKGGIVDDLLVYRINQNEYILVVNASNIQKDWDWISSQNKFGVEMRNLSDDLCLFAVQGPKAAQAMQPLTSVKLSDMVYYTFTKNKFAGIDNIIISATGYTGAGGFEIYVPNAHAVTVYNAILEAGKSFGIKPIGLGARDTLRLEMGFCLYGNDINDSTSPIEAGLGWITKFNKDFINKGSLEAQKTTGPKKKLVGFEMLERAIPRHDYEICDSSGKTIGIVTSGTMSPSIKTGIGMGYVPTELSKPDSEIFIKIRDKLNKARVVKIPFYKPN
ncbi:MAG: glycine cleavage system aminomethyltransferase GcvT [Flavobacteriales bacterium]